MKTQTHALWVGLEFAFKGLPGFLIHNTQEARGAVYAVDVGILAVGALRVTFRDEHVLFVMPVGRQYIKQLRMKTFTYFL